MGRSTMYLVGGSGAGCSDGFGASGGVSVWVGGDLFDRGQVRGCSTETLRKRVRWAEWDQGLRAWFEFGSEWPNSRNCGGSAVNFGGRMRFCGKRLHISSGADRLDPGGPWCDSARAARPPDHG